MATTNTHCPYCALQCGVTVTAEGEALKIAGDTEFPVTKGSLCVKGWSAAEPLAHPDRLRTPLIRSSCGTFEPVTWDHALEYVARRLTEIRGKHGNNAIGVFGGGALTNEKAYLLGKFARVALGTANIDYNGRFCMSSGAAASMMAFGLDRGLPFPVEDLKFATAIMLAGANVAETMPPLMQYFDAHQSSGGRLIVVDPRRTATAARANRHVAIKPGTDAAFANGLLHVLVRDNLLDHEYIRTRTEGFEELRPLVQSYWPDRVQQITGVPAAVIVDTAHVLGKTRAPMILTARGPEQQAQGVNNALAYINIALAIGAVGREYSGYGCLTGQANGQGGREHGQKSDQLPGYRHIDDEMGRTHMADVWGIPASAIPGAGKTAFELLSTIGGTRGIRSLLVMGSNVAVSAPESVAVRDKLASLDLLVVADFFMSETARLAHVVLPSAQWAEEDGTITNLEGRVLRRRRAVPPPTGVKPISRSCPNWRGGSGIDANSPTRIRSRCSTS